jgi:hypothetical protein
MSEDGDDEAAAAPGGSEQPMFGPRDPQPYLPRDAQFFQQREQPGFGGRHNSKNNNNHSNSANNNHSNSANNNANNNHNNDDDSNVERLPSFITGGASTQQNGSQQAFGQNGFEAAQGDRFPLHRRRRRHRTTRGELAQGQDGDDTSSHTPRQNGE